MASKKTNSPKRTANKKTASTPALKPSKPPEEKRNQKSCKLTEPQVQLIIDMTIAGYTNDEILNELKNEHKVVVTEKTLSYHRRCRADELNTTAEAQLKAAQARSPYMQLATRIAALGRAIDKESKKKNPSGYAIAMLAGQMDTAIKNVENLRLKMMEFEKRYAGGTDAQAQRVLEELERRSHMVQGALDGVDTMLKIAGTDFMPGSEPVEVVATVIHEQEPVANEVVPIPEPVTAHEEPAGLNEDALTAGGAVNG